MKIVSSKRQTIKECLEENNFSKHIIRNMKKNHISIGTEKKRLWETVLEKETLEIGFGIEESTIIPVKGDINVVFEDEYILIVNKPNNQASMPNRGHYKTSLANYVKYYFERNKIFNTIHLVNRLDYPTSGLVLIAKNKLIHGLLFKTDIKKKYYAVVVGKIESGVIEKPIQKDNNKRTIGGDTMAKTEYNVIKHKTNSLLDINLITGRTHQIRVHMAYLNHPIVGDKLYGSGQDLALQSYYLQFIHPITKNDMVIQIDLEERLESKI